MTKIETFPETSPAPQVNAAVNLPHKLHGSIETIPEAGITVVHGALSSEQAKDFEAELKEIMDGIEKGANEGESGDNPHKDINQARYATDLIVREGFVTISEILQKLGVAHGYHAVINHQKPHGIQKFHADDNGKVEVSSENPLFVIQGSDGGYLDYSPGTKATDPDEVAERNAVPIPLNAGDIVIQTDPLAMHRGRNGRNRDRYNLVVFSERPVLSLESAISESQTETWN